MSEFRIEQGTIRPVNDHVWIIRDDHNDTCFLVTGEKKAALIDTMNGFVNVAELARQVTKLPLFALNTHGHGDHILGNFSLEEAYLHPADRALADETLNDPEVREIAERENVRFPAFRELKHGDVFDLGGLTLETLELPGHTAGSVCFLLQEERILFTGDSINRHLWMQLDGCLTLKEYALKLEPFLRMGERVTTILHGHASGPEPYELTAKLYRGLNEIVAGKTERDSDYAWFGGIARQHPFDENSVIVYADNIG